MKPGKTGGLWCALVMAGGAACMGDAMASTVYGNPRGDLVPEEIVAPDITEAELDVRAVRLIACGTGEQAEVAVNATLSLGEELMYEPPLGLWCEAEVDMDELCVATSDGAWTCHGERTEPLLIEPFIEVVPSPATDMLWIDVPASMP